jgi:hypothetical protein
MKTYILTVKGMRGDYTYTLTTALDVLSNLTNVLTAYLAMAGARYSKFVEKAIKDGHYTIQATN